MFVCIQQNIDESSITQEIHWEYANGNWANSMLHVHVHVTPARRALCLKIKEREITNKEQNTSMV